MHIISRYRSTFWCYSALARPLFRDEKAHFLERYGVIFDPEDPPTMLLMTSQPVRRNTYDKYFTYVKVTARERRESNHASVLGAR